MAFELKYSKKCGSREANNIYVETLKKELREDIPVNVLDLDINDPIFATKVAESLIDMVRVP